MAVAYLWIALGSGLGGVARYWCSGLIADRVGVLFPWGTLTVNVAGSFMIGVAAALTGPDGRLFGHPHAQHFVIIGFCGGYTTFSTFSLQTLALIRDGNWLLAGVNIALSVIACVAAVILGHWVASTLTPLNGS